MRIYNVGLPGIDTIPGYDPWGENARLTIHMDPIPADHVFFRLRDVTVDTGGSPSGLEFALATESDFNRIRISDGAGQNPPRFYNVDVNGQTALYVYYGNGSEGSWDGLFEATIEFSFDDESWAPLSEWPGEYTIFSGGFLAADSGGAELCFWTELVLTTQECEQPPQPTGWSGWMDNFFSTATSPNTVGHGGRAFAGYERPPGFEGDDGGAVAFNSKLYAKTQNGFSEIYGTFESHFDPEYSNLRIIKIDPATGETLETTPIAGNFPGTVMDQTTGLRAQSFWADFSGAMPALEPGFWYGFIADLTCTPNAGAPPGTNPFTVEVSGSYSFDVRTLSIPGAQQDYCTFVGPRFDPDTAEYNGWSWAYNKYDQPCGGTEDVDGVYDGSPVVIPTTFTCT